MVKRIASGLVAASLLIGASTMPARADNPMGYTMFSVQEAASAPRNGGTLGLDIERSNEISSSGMTFDLIRVKSVRRGSPGERAGFRAGDQIVAVDAHVFPTLAAFAAYIGTKPPGSQAVFDYLPNRAGPGQAQRVVVTFGGPNGAPVKPTTEATQTGMSTGKKLAIGTAAVALFGCYELGCFSHKTDQAPVQPQQQLR